MQNIENKTPLFTFQILKDGSTLDNPIWGENIPYYEEYIYVQPITELNPTNDLKHIENAY